MGRLSKEYRIIRTVALVAATVIFFGLKSIPFTKPAIAVNHDKSAYVERVIDGDTLKLSTKEKVRLIGVDTPEIHDSKKLSRDSERTGQDIRTIKELGRKAADFTESLCLNKKVSLEFDVEKKDRYGRLLAYVYLDDGTFVNARIIEKGYGQVMTIPPNVRYADHFRALEQEAREDRRGLWKISE